jgi:L-seryl-tRNA(Ser) seleniumtransferase
MSDRSKVKILPSVEKILEDDEISRKINKINRRAITNIIRSVISGYRQKLVDQSIEVKNREDLAGLIVQDTLKELETINSFTQRRVINATGVILHTNLGRSILSEGARDCIDLVVSGYVDLEMDVNTGKRTKRDWRVVRLLKLLTGAEDALVVNNNAAAVMLAVNTLAGEGAVAVSRGEMVEIGGSFRLPEILSAAAGKVIEIGTTNRTHPEDYREAIEQGATLLLKVHASNYRVVGYTNEVSL